MNKGFTLIELFVTIAIIGILSSILFLGRTKEGEKPALHRSAYSLAQKLRETAEMAMGAKEISCNGSDTRTFGMHFKTGWPEYYVIFGDCNGNKQLDSFIQDKLIQTVYLEKEVKIFSLAGSDSLDIVFEPPDPTIYIDNVTVGTEAVITLSLKSDPSETKVVKINTAGRVEIE